MKYLFTLLIIFSFTCAKCQMVFQYSYGTSEMRTITILPDRQNVSKSLLYYNDMTQGPLKMIPVRDTTVSGFHILSFHFLADNQIYFLSYKMDYSSLSLYNTKMELVCDLTNDSYVLNRQFNSSSKSSIPSLSGGELLSLFKLLLL